MRDKTERIQEGGRNMETWRSRWNRNHNQNTLYERNLFSIKGK